MSLVYPTKLLDVQPTAIPGNLTVASSGLSFSSTAASVSITIPWSDVRTVTISNIGKREREGPFLELTIYHTDVQRMYTFSEIHYRKRNALLTALSDNLGDKGRIVERNYSATGWNWGSLSVSSAAVSFVPNIISLDGPKEARATSNKANADITEGIDGAGDSNGEESSSDDVGQLNEDPVEDLYFHIPTTMVRDFKNLGTREISLTLQSLNSASKPIMTIRELVFTVPDRNLCTSVYNRLTRVIDKRGSDRIISIPELSVFTSKSSKFTLEVNLRSFRFFSGNNNYPRMPDTISRYFLVEKPNHGSEATEYYFVIYFTPGNGFGKGPDGICLLLPQRKLTREVILPEDPDISNIFCQEMLCDNPRVFDDSNPPYGAYSLLSAPARESAYGYSVDSTGANSRIAWLNNVETYLVIPRLFRYLTPKKNFICTENSQACLDKKAYSPVSYGSIRIRDGYTGHKTFSCVECKNRNTQQKTIYLYFLDRRQGLLMLPYMVSYIPYSSITRVVIENDNNRSAAGKKNAVKLVVSTAGTVHEFTSIDREHCDTIEQYLASCNVSVSVSLQATNRGHSGVMDDMDFNDFNEGDDSEDQDFQASPESSSADYSEELEEVNSDDSEVQEHHDHEAQALKARTERTKKKVVFECCADIRSQDCLLAVPNPSMW